MGGYQMSNDRWKMNAFRFLIVAGEASGDAHAASLVRALRKINPDSEIEFFGASGAQMRAEGVDSVVRADELAILGLRSEERRVGKECRCRWWSVRVQKSEHG